MSNGLNFLTFNFIIMVEISQNNSRSYGSILGALIGDSIGSFLEFVPLPYN
jgi:hypothetical protein